MTSTMPLGPRRAASLPPAVVSCVDIAITPPIDWLQSTVRTATRQGIVTPDNTFFSGCDWVSALIQWQEPPAGPLCSAGGVPRQRTGLVQTGTLRALNSIPGAQTDGVGHPSGRGTEVDRATDVHPLVGRSSRLSLLGQRIWGPGKNSTGPGTTAGTSLSGAGGITVAWFSGIQSAGFFE